MKGNDLFFSHRIIQMLSQSQKMIVGHNIFLDLMFTVQQFVCEPLQTLEEFKSVLRCLFPKLLDTKLMGSMLPFRVNITIFCHL